MLVLGFKKVKNRSVSVKTLPRVVWATVSNFRQQYDGINFIPKKINHTHEWIVIVPSKASPKPGKQEEFTVQTGLHFSLCQFTRYVGVQKSCLSFHCETRWPSQVVLVGLVRVSRLVEPSTELKEVLPWYHFDNMDWFCTSSIAFSSYPYILREGVITLSSVTTRSS